MNHEAETAMGKAILFMLGPTRLLYLLQKMFEKMNMGEAAQIRMASAFRSLGEAFGIEPKEFELPERDPTPGEAKTTLVTGFLVFSETAQALFAEDDWRLLPFQWSARSLTTVLLGKLPDDDPWFVYLDETSPYREDELMTLREIAEVEKMRHEGVPVEEIKAIYKTKLANLKGRLTKEDKVTP